MKKLTENLKRIFTVALAIIVVATSVSYEGLYVNAAGLTEEQSSVQETPTQEATTQEATTEVETTEQETTVNQEGDTLAGGIGALIQAVVLFLEGEPAYYNVTFVDGFTSPATELVVQQIESGKAATAPDAPQHDGYQFLGWDSDFSNVTANMTVTANYKELKTYTVKVEYKYSDGTTAAQSYEAEVGEGKEFTQTIASPVIAGFTPSESSVVIDIDSVSTDMVTTVTYTGAATTYTVRHLQQSLTDENNYVVAETETLNGTVGLTTAAAEKSYAGFTSAGVQNVVIAADGNTTIDIKYNRNSYTLNYDTAGGSYIEPKQLKFGAKITAPSVPTKAGFTFDKWSPAITSSTTMPANDLTLVASWKANSKASYKVIYWLQSVSDESKYDYQEMSTGTGTVGAEATFTSKSYQGFSLSKNQSAPVYIASDGSTVKNVYYDRNVYTVSFYKYVLVEEGDWPWSRDRYDWQEDTSIRITARYGTDISSRWPNQNFKWHISTNMNSNFYFTIGTMPSNSISLYGEESQGQQKTVTYMVQDFNGSYTQYKKVSVSGIGNLTSEDQILIPGFVFDHWENSYFNSGKNATLYYKRANFTLSYSNVTGINNQSVPYNKVLTTYNISNLSAANRPANVDPDYTFGGWFTSPACEDGTEFVWSRTMPANNLVVYAKWNAPTYTVSFNTNGGTPSSIAQITAKKYTTIVMPANPTKTDYEFVGWYTDASFTTPFVASQQITKNITLFAKWKKTTTYAYTIICKDTLGNTLTPVTGTVLTGKAGVDTTITLNAPSVEGYLPTVSSRNVKISQEGQEIVFTYTKMTSWSYTVNFLSGSTVIKAPVTKDNVTKNVVVYTAPATIDYNGTIYTIAESERSISLTSSNNNHSFSYTASTLKSYKVEHYLQNTDGSYSLKDTVTGTGATGSKVTAETKTYAGYKSITTGNKLIGYVKADGSLTIKVYYDVDEEQTLNYSVEYFKDGVSMGTAVQKTVFVANPGVNNVDYTNMPAGYKLDTVSSTILPYTVTGNNNVIKVYYVVDESKTLSYSVEYFKDGVSMGTAVQKTVLVANPKVEKANLDYSNMPVGYKLDTVESTALPYTVTASNNVIKVYYVVDESKTVNYSVEYFKDGVSMGETQKTVLVANPVVSEVDYSNMPAGYKVDGVNSTELPYTVSLESNKINVYYVVDESKTLSYSVEYFKDGVSMGTPVVKTVLVAKPEVKEVDYTNIPTGYLIEDTSTQLPYTVTEQNKEIKVYYVADLIGEDDPGRGDEIPDKYQVKFTYISGGNGSVTGTTVEVKTRRSGEAFSLTAPVSPSAAVTATANSGYTFSNFSANGVSYANAAAIAAAKFTSDTVFTANFALVTTTTTGGETTGGTTEVATTTVAPAATTIIPTPPVALAPAPAAAPAARVRTTPAPAPAAPVVIADEDTALAATPETEAETESEVATEINEEDVPLAVLETDCYIHWIIILLTCVYVLYNGARGYVRNRKIKELQGDNETARDHV